MNVSKGANMRTTRKFDDFKLHIEFNCPQDGNSGVYLRGRYEIQVEYEDNGGQRQRSTCMGSIYGIVAPTVRGCPGSRASGRPSTSPWWAAV